MLIIKLLWLIAGFVLLIYGANWLIDGASSIARRYNVPNIVIGLTIVAFGTSAPELVVNLLAAINKNPDIVLGNVVGSNIFNVFIILGVTSLIYPLSVQKNTTWIEVPLNFLAAALLLVMAADSFLTGNSENLISRSEGIICLFFFIVFMVYNIRLMASGEIQQEELPVKMYPPVKSVVFLLLGLGMLVFGGRLIVSNAVLIAQNLGMSERIIAITIVSVGTSLPELVTSISAARKRNVDLAIGNIVGSNIFNIFFILGISSSVNAVTVPGGGIVDIAMNLLGGLLLFTFLFTGRGRRIENWEGLLFILLYAGYMFYIWPR